MILGKKHVLKLSFTHKVIWAFIHAVCYIFLAEKAKKDLVDAYSYLSGAYIKSDKAKAKDYFEKALVLNPPDAKIIEALRAIEGK